MLEWFPGFATGCDDIDFRHQLLVQFNAHERLGGHLTAGPAGDMTDDEFCVRESGRDARTVEPLGESGNELADRGHDPEDSESALSCASSSTAMHESMIGSSAPFIT